MARRLLGIGVLFLLSIFFAYVMAPAVAAIRRRVKIGKRQRPIGAGAALLLIYLAIFVPGALVWRAYQTDITEWVHVTAPAAVDAMFSGDDVDPLDRIMAHLPAPAAVRQSVHVEATTVVRYVDREARVTLGDLVTAADYAPWLAVAPVLAFVLLTGAPGFQRSTLRVLPRGHLQWRGEEFFRDVNSALAGYVRAQTVAALLVGVLAVAGFLVIGIPSAISKGVAAGVLELVPGIGPLTTLLIAVAGAGNRVVAVVVFLGLLRLVQDYFVYPRLIKQGMHLSTAAVIVTIWIGAVLAGAAGVVLAIPVAGFLSVSFRHWREYRSIEELVRTAGRRAEPAPDERVV